MSLYLFKVDAGDGKFVDDTTVYQAVTDSDGRATAQFVVGFEPGMDIHRVTASIIGTSLSATFTSSALVPGLPGNTSISGVILDNQDSPLEGVTVRVESTQRVATTDAQGQFKITQVPVGPVHLIMEGATTVNPGEWPTLSQNIVTVAGADNPLPSPVYMVKLDTANAQMVGAQDVVYTLPEIPGFKLEVKADSVTFPDGSKTGQISVTAVNASKVPMAPPNGAQPQLVYTIQPTGTMFDPPAKLTIPNVDAVEPGTELDMYSFDHDLEEFVGIGLGTVSTDGSVIQSNPGVGIIKAGWFMVFFPPPPPADVHSCGRECHAYSVATRSCVPQTRPFDSCNVCESGAKVEMLTSVSITPSPAVGASGKVSIEPDKAVTFTAEPQPNSPSCTVEYSWKIEKNDATTGANAIVKSGTGVTISHAFTNEGIYLVTVDANCSGCAEPPLSKTVTVDVAKFQVWSHRPGSNSKSTVNAVPFTASIGLLQGDSIELLTSYPDNVHHWSGVINSSNSKVLYSAASRGNFTETVTVDGVDSSPVNVNFEVEKIDFPMTWAAWDIAHITSPRLIANIRAISMKYLLQSYLGILPGTTPMQVDAARHAMWQAVMTNRIDIGQLVAKEIGDANETDGLNSGVAHNDLVMDLYNNGIGRSLRCFSTQTNMCLDQLIVQVNDALDQGQLRVIHTDGGGESSQGPYTDVGYQGLLKPSNQ